MQGVRLPFGDLAFLQLFIDAPVLVVQTSIDLGAARMVLRPFAFGHYTVVVVVTRAAAAIATASTVSSCDSYRCDSLKLVPVSALCGKSGIAVAVR